MSENIWLLHTGKDPLEVCLQEMKKWITFEPGKPQPIPRDFALMYKDRFRTLVICDEPSKYYQYASVTPMFRGMDRKMALKKIGRSLKELSREWQVLNKLAG